LASLLSDEVVVLIAGFSGSVDGSAAEEAAARIVKTNKIPLQTNRQSTPMKSSSAKLDIFGCPSGS
jgi:hypothetical protein